MSVTIKYSKQQFAKFKRSLREAAAQVDDLRIPLGEIALKFLESRKFIFDLTRTGRGKYKDLKPATKALKRRIIGQAYPILFFSGTLKDSITKTGGENVTIVEKKSLEIGTTVNYAPYHQYGTETMPKREFLFWGPESPKFASQRAVQKQNRAMAVTLFDHIERKMGKTIEASITAAERRTDKIFGKL